MDPRTACPDDATLKLLLDDSLAQPHSDSIQRHVDRCPRCQRALQELGGKTHESSSPGRTGSWSTLAGGASAASGQNPSGASFGTQTVAHAGPLAGQEDLAFLGPPHQPGHLGSLQQYQILEVIGRGGMGLVFKAYDPALERQVAIKVMTGALAANAGARQRFLREARSAAAVRHGNVVHIHAVDESGGVPYLVMQLVVGCSLQERLAQGPLPVEEIVGLGMQMAEGLAAAHERGLVHRDIKPGNVLLEGEGQKVKITDFGLARAVDGEGELTRSGVIAGTPLYMAPEQARGEPVDHRSDLFALGGVLYALCTGDSPFRAATTMAILRRVCEEAPRPIRAIRPEVPEWLESIIDKLLAKAPAERFPSARALVESLEARKTIPRHAPPPPPRTPPPIAAAPPRGRPIVALVVAGILLLIAVTLALWRPWQTSSTPEGASPAAKASPTPPKPAPSPAPPKPPVVTDGWVPLFNGVDLKDWKVVTEGVGQWMVEDGVLVGTDHNAFLTTKRDDYQNFQLRVEARIKAGGDSGVFFRSPVSFPFPRPYYEVQIRATPDDNGATGSLIGLAPYHENLIRPDEWFTLELSACGPELQVKVNGTTTVDARDSALTRGPLALQTWGRGNRVEFRKVEVKELPPPREVRTLADLRHEDVPLEERLLAGLGDPEKAPPELISVYGSTRLKHYGAVCATAFAPAGDVLATGGDHYDLLIQLWDARHGTRLGVLTGHQATITGLAFSVDGKTLISASLDKTVRFWNIAERQVINTLEHPDPVTGLSLRRDGKRLATACGGLVYIWDPATGKKLTTFACDTTIRALALSSDGKWLATGGDAPRERPNQPELKIWDVGTGQPRFTLAGHSATVQALAFSGDGLLLASGAGVNRYPDEKDGQEIRVWDALSGTSLHTFPNHTRGRILSLAFHPTKPLLVSGDEKGQAWWDAEVGKRREDLKWNSIFARSLTFDPAGQRLAAGNLQYVHIYSADGRFLRRSTSGGAFHVGFSPDGKRLSLGGWGAMQLLDPLTGARLALDQGHTSSCYALAFSGDGRWIVTAGTYEKTVKIHDATSGALLRTIEGLSAAAHCVAISSDGKRIATANEDKTVQVWDAEEGKELHLLRGHTLPVARVAFRPGTHQLAAASGTSGTNGEVLLWDTDSGKLLRTIREPGEGGRFVAFSRDAKWLATRGKLKEVLLYDADTGLLVQTLTGFPSDPLAATFSPDGSLLAAADFSGRLIIWELRGGAPRWECQLPGTIMELAFSPDGNHLASANYNGSAYLFRVPPTRPRP